MSLKRTTLKMVLTGIRSLLLISLFIASTSAEEDFPYDFSQTTPEDLGVGKTAYFYGPPPISRAQHSSWSMPPEFRCDACIAVAYQFTKHFTLEEERRSKKGAKLSEIQVTDVADKLCSKGLKKYGARNLNGKVRLSGQGLRALYEPGITGIGPGWRERMQGMCKEIVGEVEEMPIYNMYRNKGDGMLAESLCKSYCTKERIVQLREDEKFIDNYFSEKAGKDKSEDELSQYS